MRSFELGPQAAKQVQRVVRRSELGGKRARRSSPQLGNHSLAVYVCKTGAGGIPAMVGDVVGSADVTVQGIDDDDELYDAIDSNGNVMTITVKNTSTSAVAADTVIHVKQELATGRQVVDFENCGS